MPAKVKRAFASTALTLPKCASIADISPARICRRASVCRSAADREIPQARGIHSGNARAPRQDRRRRAQDRDPRSRTVHPARRCHRRQARPDPATRSSEAARLRLGHVAPAGYAHRCAGKQHVDTVEQELAAGDGELSNRPPALAPFSRYFSCMRPFRAAAASNPSGVSRPILPRFKSAFDGERTSLGREHVDLSVDLPAGPATLGPKSVQEILEPGNRDLVQPNTAQIGRGSQAAVTDPALADGQVDRP